MNFRVFSLFLFQIWCIDVHVMFPVFYGHSRVSRICPSRVGGHWHLQH